MVAIAKKLSQLKQWTGEKLGTVERSNEGEEFQRLLIETESRKDGIEKLTSSLMDYVKTLDKRSSINKKESVLVVLATSMSQQSFFHGENSELGVMLKSNAENQRMISEEQLKFSDISRKDLLMHLMNLHTSMKDFESLKKKFNNRRLDYDAKVNKLSKSKREKPGLEEEMKNAELKYTETRDDIECLMRTFAEREESIIESLKAFQENQLKYFENCASILASNKGLNEKFQGNKLTKITELEKNVQLKTKSNEKQHTEKFKQVVAIYDFKAENNDELSIKKGDIIDVIKRVDNDWYIGILKNNKGIFPITYVEDIIQSEKKNLKSDSFSISSNSCSHCGCENFSANVFKKDSCNLCFHKH